MTVGPELFSQKWLDSWKHEINHSDYKSLSKGWNEPILIKANPPGSIQENENGFFLELNAGYCSDVRYSTSEDEINTDVILAADIKVWKEIIQNRKDPLFMLMMGKLKLEKGSLSRLSTYSKSARSLLEAAYQASERIFSDVAEAKTPEATMPEHDLTKLSFVTTGRGLDMDSFPMQLFQKAKQLGIWNPADISFEEDVRQWINFTDIEKKVLIHLSSMFIAGEEAVTMDLLPLIRAVSRENRLEEEIYLTSFLWEEAKHTEFFSLFIDQVVGRRTDLTQFHGYYYNELFSKEFPDALRKLDEEPTPENQLKASVTYNLIVEGTLAETGYEAYFQMLERNDMLPGLREGISHLKKDESRHIAFGLYFLKRLMKENPGLEEVLEQESSRLLNIAIEVVHEIFEPYPEMPFGLEKSWYIDYASNQFRKRMTKLTEHD
jgi:ribonucleoside-diphosphate reductase beta chain